MFNLIPWKKKNKHSVSDKKSIDNMISRLIDNDFLPSSGFFREDLWYPSIDISEGKKDIVVTAELPGIENKDINISLEGRQLIIKGEKRHENENSGENYYRVERLYGSFNRTAVLPADVDPEKVDAFFRKGILTIKLKKLKDSESKKIKVKSA
ncbi:MAG: Hsp20/alpha crystallin family protein [Desulfobacterales bacterium]|nr:Hsp20/alpha crystallin family protein [Desulfobacterales bacterium]